MAGRVSMPPSSSAAGATSRAAAGKDAAAAESTAAAGYARLQQYIERECADCDAAITEHRQQVADYRSQKEKLDEVQKKVAHPIMVPFGGVGFMPGKLVRTNEVMVLLGANYFAECSVHETGKIIDRRCGEIAGIIDKLEQQKRQARERLSFAQGLFGGGGGAKDDMVEIREEYDEQKELDAKQKRAERAATARAEKKVPQATFENMMSRLDELEQEEKAEGGGKRKMRAPRAEPLDSDDESEEERDEEEDGQEKEEEEEEYVEPSEAAALAVPKGVNEEEYKKLLARLDQLEAEDCSDEEEEEEDSDDVIEEEDEEDADDDERRQERKLSGIAQLRAEKEGEEWRKMREREEMEKRAAQQQPKRLIEVIDNDETTVPSKSLAPTAAPKQSITTKQQQPKMTVVSENDRVVDLVEYQHQQEEEDKAKENEPSRKGLSHKRSVRFKKNLEAGPCEKSIDSVDDVLSSVDSQVNPRSILRNKSEESPIDKIAFSEMEDQRSTTILPSGDAFSGCVVERSVSAELPIIFKPVDEPPRRVSRFKLQRMQQATE